MTVWLTLLCLLSVPIGLDAQGLYTTRGTDIVDTRIGEPVLLQGFGLGGWLLPEGYMWGIRTLDRPWQFEEGIVDLIGENDAAEFWRLYHENFVTAADFESMKAMGANSIRIPLLASKLQPREGQPDGPPYRYSEEGFRFLDSVMVWAVRFDLGVIWDMHGAPGGQNAENISDSDGEARLWTEKETYWPRLTDLWYRIASRYLESRYVIGYDLLNEPLLARYDGIDPSLLRELYVQLTDTIRTLDPQGLIFIEGDDWAQNFEMLEPMDWDPHLVMAFHSYPPTSNQEGLQRWDDLRRRYNIPLWHGETGEQSAPYNRNLEATRFLNEANVGWSWWTHKKLDRWTQPWLCPKTEGFQSILDYWMGRAERPSSEQARDWFFEQARRTNSRFCGFFSEMVASLEPFDPTAYLATREPEAPSIYEEPDDVEVEVGQAAVLGVGALGFPLAYSWKQNGSEIPSENAPRITYVPRSSSERVDRFQVTVSNALGVVTSREALVRVVPFSGPEIPRSASPPVVDAEVDGVWSDAPIWMLDHPIISDEGAPDATDLSAQIRLLWDDHHLYFLVEVTDAVAVNTNPISYQNDGVEIYIDFHADKSLDYGVDDYHVRYVRGHERLEVAQGTPLPSVIAMQVETELGYRMEIAFPFSALSQSSRSHPFVGLEVHVNDNDKDRREDKLGWFGNEDNAYASPSVFGTIKLSGSR